MKYNYNIKDEKIELEGINLTVSFNNEQKLCNVVKTDKSVLFFEDYTTDDILRARGVNMLQEYKLIHKEELNDIIIEKDEGNTIITTKDGNEIIIFKFLIS